MRSPPQRAPLPIDAVLPELVERLRACPNLVVEAPPGAGKTTRVPLALLDAGVAGDGEVWVLEPRRLAARMAARRVAEELGEPLGERVGYAVRFEEVGGPRTRLRFVTQGVLLRRLLAPRGLDGVRAVVFDEFHERTLDGDVALALLRRVQRERRPALRLVVMSATLDAEPVAEWLGAERVRSEGRRYEVAIDYLDGARASSIPASSSAQAATQLGQQVAGALRRLVDDGLDGDVLVFLPGAREIRRAEEACRPLAARHDLLLLTLHGDQSPAEQDRAVRPTHDGRRKLVLATNVAETSVTIEGVAAVIDSGLHRLAEHAPWSGLPTLRLAKVSRASATQRAGRAGRTRPGRALRLYSRHDHDGRPAFDVPEVRRADLAGTALLLRAVDVDLEVLEWFEAPSPGALQAADALLARLGAVEPGASPATLRLSALGRALLRFPLHPRLARLLYEAEAQGVVDEGARVAAWLGEGRRAEPHAAASSGDSDLYPLPDEGSPPSTERAARALLKSCRRDRPRPSDPEAALRCAVLAGFPDRVARRRRPHQPEVLLSSGGMATLAPSSVVREAELLVAVEASERRESGVVIHTACAIEADWLLDLFPERLRDEEVVEWNARAERVEVVRRLSYDRLVLDETRASRSTDETTIHAMSRVLAEAAWARGLGAFVDDEELERLLARLELVAVARPEVGLAVPDEPALREALTALCHGRTSFEELRHASLLDALQAHLTPAQRELLARLVPERVVLPGGRAARVEYRRGQPPSLASRLQDFFGLSAAPLVAGAPLTLHLLAPNQRAVQVTSDLAGFWQRHYPALRRELMRRYPKHAWPDDPLVTSPPKFGRPR